jgi:hypothetical protein
MICFIGKLGETSSFPLNGMYHLATTQEVKKSIKQTRGKEDEDSVILSKRKHTTQKKEVEASKIGPIFEASGNRENRAKQSFLGGVKNC